MGSGASKKNPILECPKNCNSEKFKKICILFDKLDTDANFGVSSDELTDIARLHVENCQQKLEKRLATKKSQHQHNLQEIDEDGIQKIAGIRLATETRKQSTTQQHDMKQKSIQSKIDWYKSLDEDGKENAFMKVLKPKDSKHIDFWTFFEYMKSRTEDISNVEHSN